MHIEVTMLHGDTNSTHDIGVFLQCVNIGNVGIGTTSPGKQLQVASTISTTANTNAGNPGQWYVFRRQYSDYSMDRCSLRRRLCRVC